MCSQFCAVKQKIAASSWDISNSWFLSPPLSWVQFIFFHLKLCLDFVMLRKMTKLAHQNRITQTQNHEHNNHF